MENPEKITDPWWRLANLYYIRTKKGESKLLELNKTQKWIVGQGVRKSNLNMILKGRQQGVSTFFLIYYLNKVCFTRNYTAAILSHDRESIEKLFRVIRYAYEHMPKSLRPQLDRGGGSKYMFYFPTLKSRIYVALEVRSEAINALHVSEYGFMDKKRFNASIEAVPVDGEISIESTANGMNHFYTDWNNPNFPYLKHFFPWFFHLENQMPRVIPFTKTAEEKLLIRKAKEKYSISLSPAQILWRRFKISQTSKASFDQEHPEDDKTCFLTSGDSVFNLEALDEKINSIPEPIENDSGLKIIEDYIRGNNYCIGADTAEGVGGDRSAAVVYCTNSRKQVAQLHGQFPPKIFAEKLAELGKRYSGPRGACSIAVERNNHGHAVLLWLDSHCQYPFIFEDDDGRHGWKTNKQSRPLMIDELVDAIENNIVELTTWELLDECMTLVNNNGKIEAIEKKHDDLFIAMAIALQASKKSKHYLMDWINNM